MDKLRKKILIVAPLLFGLGLYLFFTSTKPTRIQGEAMTMGYCVQIGHRLKAQERAQVDRVIEATFEEIDLIFNDYNPHSEISALNKLPAREVVMLSTPLVTFLNKTAELVELSEGRFDPTMAPLCHLWQQYLKKGALPPEEELAPLKAVVGWDKIHIEHNHFWKEHEQTQLDLGGIAKGYAVDLLLERIQKLGYPNLFIAWGGEIRTTGHHSSGRPWKVGIAGITTLSLDNEAIATSGNYLQHWQVGDHHYSHIINPLTLEPLEIKDHTMASTSVVASTCMVADALATSLMLFDTIEEGKLWAKEHLVDMQTWMVDNVTFTSDA